MKRIALNDRNLLDNDEILKLHSERIESIKEGIANDGNELIGEFYDKCSGHVPLDERPEYSRLYQLCNSGHVDELYIVTISRLSRELRTVAQMCREMHEMDIKVNFVKEKITSEELLNSQLAKSLGEVFGQEMGM